MFRTPRRVHKLRYGLIAAKRAPRQTSVAQHDQQQHFTAAGTAVPTSGHLSPTYQKLKLPEVDGFNSWWGRLAVNDFSAEHKFHVLAVPALGRL